jgi:tetratricopeptide (TPR) repeat protein
MSSTRRRRGHGLALLLGAFLMPAQKPQPQPQHAPPRRPADVLEEEAERLLASSDPAAAEVKAREALAKSLFFKPEDEIEVRPDKGLLFDDMILQARKSYQARRVRYFRTLGRALDAQKKWPESRKAFRRALAIEPSAELPLLMAAQGDLDLESRLDLLLDAYLTPGSDRPTVEQKLLATGAFRTRDALKASLDQKRFPRLHTQYPELELLPGTLAEFQATTDSGTIIPSQLFRTGATLVLYVPVEGCARCSEELDGLTVPILESRKHQSVAVAAPLEIVAFVRESDLPGTRRIVRLLGVPVGVSRKEGLSPSLGILPEGELRFVARSGMTQIRFPTGGMSSSEIRRRVEAILEFFSEPGMPTEDRPELASEPLVTLRKGTDDTSLVPEWIETIAKLEAGPAPIGDLYGELNRRVQRIAAKEGDRPRGLDLLDALSRLSGANAAKSRALGLVGEHLGEDLLKQAKAIDPSVRSTPPGESGALRVAIDRGSGGAPACLYLQRSFEADDGSRFFDFVLEDDGTDTGTGFSVRFAAEEQRGPLGIEPTAKGAAFESLCADGNSTGCRAARLVEGPTEWKVRFEGEPVLFRDRRLFESRSALVDDVAPPGGGPRFYRNAASDDKGALERGLELFRAADFAGAASAFEQAAKEIDPAAPYDESDLVYDRAGALEELGKRREALALFRSLADVSYQSRVDERASLIESGRGR